MLFKNSRSKDKNIIELESRIKVLETEKLNEDIILNEIK